MYSLQTQYKKILADTITPVSVYLKLRDKFPNSLLLESSDYHTNNNSFSYICCNPIASITVDKEQIITTYPDDLTETKTIVHQQEVIKAIASFSKKFTVSKLPFKFIHSGLFGYIAYDAVRYFEQIKIQKKDEDLDIPDIQYFVYKNIIVIDHFKNQAYIFCHSIDGRNNIKKIESYLYNKNFTSYNFSRQGEIRSNIHDDDFIDMVRKAKQHCQLGDVFQLVLSKRFSVDFKGDDFNIYRALRSINPSPYLFYFDYSKFKIFGSSPEAQLVVNQQQAEIHPIAGTFKRKGNDLVDAKLAKKLIDDPKENAEHIMLVDLARNDLSKNSSEVNVAKFKEVQFFSHVIHLVSKVVGKVIHDTETMQIVADTFPAGTLSGAPKYKAMELIEQYENTNRTFYGGAIGYMDFDGNFNHAIMIRTFLSKNYTLHYQAGAGLVVTSEEEKELQEVYNKLKALNKALEIAEII